MGAAADAPRVVLSSAPDRETGVRLARALVGAGLAGCVNVVGDATSVYLWEGAVQEEREVLLVIKTCAGVLEELERRLVREHPYDVPECVALAPERVEARYLAWLQASVARPGGPGDA
jgi:periplasmic divalent cation tolerance protein